MKHAAVKLQVIAMTYVGCQHLILRLLLIPGKAHEHGVQLIVVSSMPVLIRLDKAGKPE